jgi:hypothetical protein
VKLIEVQITVDGDNYDCLKKGQGDATILEEYVAYGREDAYSQAEAMYPDAVRIEIVGRVA